MAEQPVQACVGGCAAHYLDNGMKCHAPPTSNSTLPNGPSLPANGEWGVRTQAVSTLCEKGQLDEALDVLGILVQTKSRFSTSLLHSLLKRCVSLKDLVVDRRIHDLAIKLGYESNTFLGNHILRMYASQGRLQEAIDVFNRVVIPDAFMWSSIISAYARHVEPNQAIQLYQQMRSSSVKPDGHVFVAVLQACACAADLAIGGQVHFDVMESGVPPDLFVCNCLVDMYAKCGKLEDARSVFDSLSTRDVVTWNAMIGGYAEHGFGQEALAMYAKLEQEGLILADGVTYTCLLKGCASSGALQQGKQLHSRILESGLLDGGDTVLGNCLVEMYAKCGKLKEARTAFESLPSKNVLTWNTMINGYGQGNEGRKAIDCFEEMLQADVQPTGGTFISLLVACSHDGLVNEGRGFLKAMVEDHGLMPTREHYTCMVDLLGRAGQLDEAETMVLSLESDYVGLKSLLHACRSYGDIERGARCFDRLVRMDPQHASPLCAHG